MIRILIVDDHVLVREGLTLILEKTGEMKVVAEHANGIAALDWLLNNDCDVALIDVSMPGINGTDLLRLLRERNSTLPVLVISAHPQDQYAAHFLKAGANGYLVKECAPEDVVAAVRCVVGGEKYLGTNGMPAAEPGASDARRPHETLSNREHQIFLLLASEKTIAEIAATLRLSGEAIAAYRNRILEKTGLRDEAELVRYAIENRLTT